MRKSLEIQMLRADLSVANADADQLARDLAAASTNVADLSAELARTHRAIRFALGDLQPGIQPYGTLADLLPHACPDVTT